jgi:hypothetical protein
MYCVLPPLCKVIMYDVLCVRSLGHMSTPSRLLSPFCETRPSAVCLPLRLRAALHCISLHVLHGYFAYGGAEQVKISGTGKAMYLCISFHLSMATAKGT